MDRVLKMPSLNNGRENIANDIKSVLADLAVISRRAEKCSHIVAIITLSNLSSLLGIALVTQSKKIGAPYDGVFPIYLLLILGVFLFSALLLVLSIFEKSKNIGNIYYQEISDSMEWEKVDREVRVRTRIQLKKFIMSATLPFVRESNSGPAFYLTFNLIILIGSFIIS